MFEILKVVKNLNIFAIFLESFNGHFFALQISAYILFIHSWNINLIMPSIDLIEILWEIVNIEIDF